MCDHENRVSSSGKQSNVCVHKRASNNQKQNLAKLKGAHPAGVVGVLTPSRRLSELDPKAPPDNSCPGQSPDHATLVGVRTDSVRQRSRGQNPSWLSPLPVTAGSCLGRQKGLCSQHLPPAPVTPSLPGAEPWARPPVGGGRPQGPRRHPPRPECSSAAESNLSRGGGALHRNNPLHWRPRLWALDLSWQHEAAHLHCAALPRAASELLL